MLRLAPLLRSDMPIVWDERKRRLNLAKHGMDFERLEERFEFTTALYTTANEKRVMAIGWFDGRICVLVFRPMGREAISAVSLRIASPKEKRAYAQRKQEVR